MNDREMNLNGVGRREFGKRVAFGGIAAVLGGGFVAKAQMKQGSTKQKDSEDVWPAFPSQPRDQVREVVGKSHFDLSTVKKLVEARPQLAIASHDWGFGDWETALGAASHVGRPEIVEVLMAHGARPDQFTFAMLGQLDALKACIDANPGLQGRLGPHGITLMAHARAGRDRATKVVEYLEKLGGSDTPITDLPLAENEISEITGNYKLGQRELVVSERKGQPQLTVDGGVSRWLLKFGTLSFSPAGVPSVRLIFEKARGTVERLRIVDAESVFTAERA